MARAPSRGERAGIGIVELGAAESPPTFLIGSSDQDRSIAEQSGRVASSTRRHPAGQPEGSSRWIVHFRAVNRAESQATGNQDRAVRKQGLGAPFVLPARDHAARRAEGAGSRIVEFSETAGPRDEDPTVLEQSRRRRDVIVAGGGIDADGRSGCGERAARRVVEFGPQVNRRTGAPVTPLRR